MDIIIKEHKEDKETRKNGAIKTNEDLVDVLLKFHDSGDLDHNEFSLTSDNIKAVILVSSIYVQFLYIISFPFTKQINLIASLCL